MFITKTNPAKFSFVGPMIVLSLKVGRLSRIIKKRVVRCRTCTIVQACERHGTSFEEVRK